MVSVPVNECLEERKAFETAILKGISEHHSTRYGAWGSVVVKALRY